jgi:hypothetical protein
MPESCANFCLQRATIVRAQGASEGEKFAAELTQQILSRFF